MRDNDLNQLLRSGRAPEWSAEYWEEFPGVVVRTLRRDAIPAGDGIGGRSGLGSARRRWGLALALAASCVVLGVFAGFRLGRLSAPGSLEARGLGQYVRELEALFPRQIQAIVMEPGGMRLVLSDKADVPVSSPVYVRICEPDEGVARCRAVITFSGQRVRLQGEEFEILLDAEGGVIVVARQGVWSSAGPRSTSLPYRIEARVLENAG